ncbi:MAG: choice-of-anchor B family protein [Melioribacteraceae bacterium]|nr:MAG: choice-of-anchor B family protein [Melioribacteraceae bacterium]
MNRIISVITLNIFLFISINAQEGIELLGSINPRASQGYNDIWGYAADGREYALLGAGGGTSIIDVTDPNVPDEVAFIAGPPSSWRDLKTYSHYAYIVTEGTSGDNGLQIVDLSGLPNSVSLVKTTNEFFERAHNIFIVDKYALVIGTNNGGGMHILDLTDPENPERTAYYLESGYVHDVYAWGDTVVACAEDTYDLVDISDKSNPKKISSSIALPGIYAHSGWATEDKKYFIAAEEFNQRDITIWNIEDRNNWDLVVDEFKLSNTTPVHNIFVKGDYAHISYYADGYVVLDVSDPTNPLVVGQYDTSPSESGFNGAWGCYPFLPSGNIIISDMQTGLYVFSFTPVENPAPFLSPVNATNEILVEENVDLGLEVMDNGTIVEAYVYYRTIINSATGNWNRIDGELTDNNEFNFTIPSQQHLTTVEYYYAVADDGGKVVTSPSGGGGTPAGSVPPETFYSYRTIFAGTPVIVSLSPVFSDTTIVKGDKIEFTVEAVDTTQLDISYEWFLNGQKKSNLDSYTYGTTFVFAARTDTLDLVVTNGYKSVSNKWIISVDLTSDLDDDLTLSYDLVQNYPNPFNPSTTISYSIPASENVQLKVFNSLGELVSTLVDSYQNSGKYEVNFDARELSSGFYIAHVVAGKFSKSIKMLLVK